MPPPSSESPQHDVARALADAHGAVTLATALVLRLRADGRGELAAAVEALGLATVKDAFGPVDPDPHVV